MNDFNNSNDLKNLVINTFQEILTEDPNFFFKQVNILTWKSKKIDGALITKIGNQRYLGLVRKDSQGQEYWKYKPLTKPAESEQSNLENSDIQPNSLDKVAKFQQRQDQAKDYGNIKQTEPSVNTQSS